MYLASKISVIYKKRANIHSARFLFLSSINARLEKVVLNSFMESFTTYPAVDKIIVNRSQ